MTTAFTEEEQRFLQLLDDNPEFRDAVRRRLLSEELFNLPAQFASFVANVNAFIEQQRQFNEERRRINLEQRRTNARVDSRLESLERGQSTIIGQLDALRGEIGDLKGDRTIQATIRKGPQICRQLNLRFIRRLEQTDLINLITAEDSADLPDDDLESFENADLVMESTDANGNPRLVVVEASHTANRNDTGRALRNARYLNRFTGTPATAVIASAQNDAEVDEQIENQLVHWHRLQQRDLHPR